MSSPSWARRPPSPDQLKIVGNSTVEPNGLSKYRTPTFDPRVWVAGSERRRPLLPRSEWVSAQGCAAPRRACSEKLRIRGGCGPERAARQGDARRWYPISGRQSFPLPCRAPLCITRVRQNSDSWRTRRRARCASRRKAHPLAALRGRLRSPWRSALGRQQSVQRQLFRMEPRPQHRSGCTDPRSHVGGYAIAPARAAAAPGAPGRPRRGPRRASTRSRSGATPRH